MFRQITLLCVLAFFALVGYAQNERQDYQGEWIGFLPDRNSFNFQVSLQKLEGGQYHLTIANEEILVDKSFKSAAEAHIFLDLDQEFAIHLQYNESHDALTGYIKTPRYYYSIWLEKESNNRYVGAWNPFMQTNGLQSVDMLLYVENREGENLVAYPFFGDQRFRGAWPSGFKLKGNTLLFRDQHTGFNYRAKLLKDTIELEILLIDALLAKTRLTHTNEGWDYNMDSVDQSQNTSTPFAVGDGWATANINDYGISKSILDQLIDSVHAQNLINTHSVLIAKDNKLVFETYFDGFNATIPHDLRSASKSISSAMIGIAIDEGIIESVDQKLYKFIPKDLQYTSDSLKSKISIKDLLTMSSGLDVNEQANEDFYQNPSNSKGWLKAVLETPMVHEPGTYADYGSANPFLLGVYLNERLEVPLYTYMDQKLFAPLGITNYINQTDDGETTPYFGGGMLLTPRDLLKFGQLYLDNGIWQGKQIISEKWVKASFAKHVKLQDTKDKNEYGYLWWHDTYSINGRSVNCIEARGAGGQFIFVIPELKAVVAITSGNFRNGKGNQPRTIMAEYILPALLE